jgi:hypothetical protein
MIPCAVHADGLIRKLPGNGAWVKYHAVLVGGGTEMIGSVDLRSVGTVVQNGEACRWIELEFHDGPEVEPTVYKLLIPEKELRSGVDPVDHIVRAWEKTPDAEAKRIDDTAVLDRGFVGAFLHGPVEKPKKLDEVKQVPYQDGNLKCAGIHGDRPIEWPNFKATLRSTTWTNEKVPFGVAALIVELIDQNSESTLKVELTVSEFGMDAKSKLPNVE